MYTYVYICIHMYTYVYIIQGYTRFIKKKIGHVGYLLANVFTNYSNHNLANLSSL